MVKRKRFIAVAGNIGTGKTELVDFLCRRYELKPFFEPNDTNPYLEDFYRDMAGFAFHSQIYFLTHKFRLHRALEREPGTVVQDRTIYEDAEIFARNLRRQKYINQRDWTTYSELYSIISSSLAPPDLMIYLHAPVARSASESRRAGAPWSRISRRSIYGASITSMTNGLPATTSRGGQDRHRQDGLPDRSHRPARSVSADRKVSLAD